MSTMNGLSTTDNLHFAAFLDATDLLTFVSCVPAGVGDKILFRFRDPEGLIDQFYENYSTGAECPAIDFSASLRRLRREMGKLESTNRTRRSTAK